MPPLPARSLLPWRTAWHRLLPLASERRNGGPARPRRSSTDSCAPPSLSSTTIEGSGLIVAYEPVWAIGTGDAASPGDAQQAAAQIRAILAERDPAGAAQVPILYGGSCTADNAEQLFAEPDVDGALVGGASLDPAGFARIVRAAAEARG